jgi:hypothetical protein
MLANSNPQLEQNFVYGDVIGFWQIGQRSSIFVPSLMQYRSLDLAGTARVQRGQIRYCGCV